MLSQRRFTYLPNDSGQKWLIPITVRTFTADGESRAISIWMDSAEMRIDVAREVIAFKLNDGQTGFYRVKYANPEDRQRLSAMVHQKTLTPEDRWGLQNDLFALTVAGDIRLEDYLAFLEHYRTEDSYLPLASIAANLSHAHLIVEPETAGRIGALAGLWLQGVLRKF